MGSKRFHTRRLWHNTLLVLWSAPIPLLIGVLVFAVFGAIQGLLAIATISLVALMVALSRDAQNRSTYFLRDDRLDLHGRGGVVTIELAQVIDASLVDRAAAREYISVSPVACTIKAQPTASSMTTPPRSET